MAKRKIEGSLAGLLDEKEDIEQLNSVIPTDLSREFNHILEVESISMAKGVSLAINLFNARLREFPVGTREEGPSKATVQLLKKAMNPELGRADLKGDFIGRLTFNQMQEFHFIRKRNKLKVYEATAIAAYLLIEYYKDHKRKSPKRVS